MKKYILLLLLSVVLFKVSGQTINQNQQNVNINLPVIEKPVYIERYRTVYIERPKVAKQLSEPIVLLGYLTVFPRDLGYYNTHPNNIISNVNKQNLYGRNTWRLPSAEELKLMEAYADEIGLCDEIYMANSHSNGTLRLVSTETTNRKSAREIEETLCGAIINNLLWSARNGILDPEDTEQYYTYHSKGSFLRVGGNVTLRDSYRCTYVETSIPMTHREFYNSNIPSGWRLPTKSEFLQLLRNAEYLSVCFDSFNRKWGRFEISKDGFNININVTPTIGSMGGYRQTIGCSVCYLVEEGVISLDFSRFVENIIYDRYYYLIKDREGIDYLINTVIEFEATKDKSGFVRLVRDL